jgi:hypothetical protein
MMSAMKAMEITAENIFMFKEEAMKVIEESISPKLNDAILASARNLQQEARLFLIKSEYRWLIPITSKEEFFIICLDNYIKEQKFKNIKIEPTKDYINISFRW